MQDSISVRTPAKINLSLDILGKRHDGYHFVRTIMQAVSLFDEISIELKDTNEIRIFCDTPGIPCDHRNLVHKAAIAFFEYVEKEPVGMDIKIDKKIPALAGLAGGSSNAAGMIVALNELLDTNLSVHDLCEIGEAVGADVPFCILGATAVAEGVGDIINPLPNLPECYIVIVKPEINISTAEAFNKYDSLEASKVSDYDDIIAGLAMQDIEKISSLLFNALEFASSNEEIEKIKETMLDMDALGSIMTGSGSAVYGIFDKKRYASKCAEELSKNYDFVEICSPLSCGVEII